jgi:hypothetical protein
MSKEARLLKRKNHLFGPNPDGAQKDTKERALVVL